MLRVSTRATGTGRLNRAARKIQLLRYHPSPNILPQGCDQESPAIADFIDDFGRRFAQAVAGLGLDADQDGIAVAPGRPAGRRRMHSRAGIWDK